MRLNNDIWAGNDGTAAVSAPGQLPREQTDEELMQAYGSGNMAAFDQLYARHRDGLFRFILRQVGQPALADELFQDVWMRLIDSRNRYQVRARFKTYLYRIARNRVIDYYRATTPDSLEAPDELPGNDPTADQLVGQRDAAATLAKALALLPLEQRCAVVLRLERDLGLNEIASICGCGRETVKSRLRYAMARLRQALGEQHELWL